MRSVFVALVSCFASLFGRRCLFFHRERDSRSVCAFQTVALPSICLLIDAQAFVNPRQSTIEFQLLEDPGRKKSDMLIWSGGCTWACILATSLDFLTFNMVGGTGVVCFCGCTLECKLGDAMHVDSPVFADFFRGFRLCYLSVLKKHIWSGGMMPGMHATHVPRVSGP